MPNAFALPGLDRRGRHSERDWRCALARAARLPAPAGAIDGRVWKELREVAAVTEWAAVMRERHGARITRIRSHPRQDAPDCLFRLRGREHTAEVTEIIDEALAKFRTAQARERVPPPLTPPSLTGGFWTGSSFRDKLSARVARKCALAKAHRRRIDALIVTTFEPLLAPAEVERWLASWHFEPTADVRAGWLVMESDPAFSPQQPVFPLFGTLPEPPRPVFARIAAGRRAVVKSVSRSD